jgi:hypothetical protein
MFHRLVLMDENMSSACISGDPEVSGAESISRQDSQMPACRLGCGFGEFTAEPVPFGTALFGPGSSSSL